MPNSVNGWTGIINGSSGLMAYYKIPGTNTSVKVLKSVAPVLISFAAEWNRDVEKVDHSPLDAWGWAYRDIGGTSSLSNHASGTAIDLCASRLPQHARRLTSAQLAAVNKLIKKYKVITNGSQWSNAFRDEMHTEISNGVTQTQVNEVIRFYKLNTTTVPGNPVPIIIIGVEEMTKGYVYYKKAGHVNAGWTVEVIDGVAVLRWIQNSQALRNLVLAGIKPMPITAAALALFPTVGTLPPVG